MTQVKRFLDVLIAIGKISNDQKLTFEERMELILREVAGSVQAGRSSIMLLKGRDALEVVASTTPELIGVEQSLEAESPSTWVVKNKKPLYLDNQTGGNDVHTGPGEYEKKALLVTPIISNGKVIGILNLTEKLEKDVFEKEEQEMLLNFAGQIIGAIENQRLNETLKKKKLALQRKNQKLKRLEQLKTDLFNMLIHDLKGPISEMVVNLDILTYSTSEENLQFVESAQTGCDTLQAMVSNLLEVARLEEGKIKLVHEEIDPRDLLKEALGRLSGLSKMKGLKFEEQFPPSDNAPPLWGDRALLLRILQNLLNNAIQFSPKEETIGVGYRHSNTKKIEFFVHDNGPGVEPEFQDIIFDKYKQLDNKHDGRVYTVGLGLAFCKMAVEAHKGEIGVESKNDQGSHFWFKLPLTKKMKKKSVVKQQ